VTTGGGGTRLVGAFVRFVDDGVNYYKKDQSSLGYIFSFLLCHLGEEMSAQLLTIFIVVTTVALMIVPMNSSNGNLYNVETAINEDDNKFSFNLQLLDWHVGYNKFTVAQYAETPLDLKNLCG